MLGLGNTLSGGIVPAAASFANEYSLVFDGTNDYVTTSNVSLDTGSWSVWYKGELGSSLMFLICGDVNYRIMWQPPGNTRFVLYWATGVGWTTFSPPAEDLDDDNWHHLVWTLQRDGAIGTSATMKLYYDGSLEVTDTGTGSGSVASKPLVIGNGEAGSFGDGYEWNGYIDEVGFWNDHILTADEVTVLYNSRSPIDLQADSGNYVSSGNLTHYYRMGDGDTYPTITDNQGSLDGTMTNMTSGDIQTEVP
tara:strand:- start:352 stop:1101 length:750 start_codon:yes stop_codon:yes gene_type:complete